MGFYDGEFERDRRRPKGLKWVAVVVLSALVGSGATLATVPMLIHSNAIQVPSPTSDNLKSPSSSTPVSNVSVNVNDGVVSAVNKVKAAIVGVANYQNVSDFFNQNQTKETGEGSGIIFDQQGYVVTNNHVVEGASTVEVLLPDGRKTKATVVGTDKYSDLAVLQIPKNYVTGVASFGDSDKLQVGEPAIAIGNPLGHDFSQTVTVGVISALKRSMPVTDEQTGAQLATETYLQTDAAINPGNSGGALVNVAGQVIGINSAKIASTGVEGMGFAIPINEARPVIDDLIKYGHVNYPALGISAEDVSQLPSEVVPQLPVDYGVIVAQVSSSSAKQAGLKRGDVIVAINDDKVQDSVSLHTLLNKYKVGDTVHVTIYRGGSKKTLSIKLMSLSDLQAQGGSSGGNRGNNGGFGGNDGGSNGDLLP
jgi:serine protease Do